MFNDLPPLTSLRAFEAAVRLGAFNLAAEELKVTPAAIGAQIRSLEDWVGYALFERRNRRVFPTAQALRLQHACETSFSTLKEALTALAPDDTSLKIGVGSLFASRWLSPRLSDFWVSHPDISLRLVHSPVLEGRLPNDFDAAILWGADVSTDFSAQRILQPKLVPVASPDYIAKHGSPVLPGDLAAHQLIQEQGTELWRAWFMEIGHSVPDTLTGTAAGDGTVAMQLALDGQGICIGVQDFVEDALEQGRLITLFEPRVVKDYAYTLVLGGARHPKPAARRFAAWIAGLSHPPDDD